MNNTLDINHIDDNDLLFDEDSASDVINENNVKPYDPRLIRVEPKMFSLRNILDMIDEGDLDLAPDFQRLKVWKPWQKSRLIESILLRIPLPAFYFASDEDGKLQVVDGVQRLSTIYNFVRGKQKDRFSLVKLEYLENEVGDKDFSEIQATPWAKRIYSTQIVANVIDPQTPMRVKFDIFKRINTGGTPLNAQEIRHCMSGAQSRRLLSKLAAGKPFNVATGNKLFEHVRMGDREIILRVLAMNILGLDGFLVSESMDDFLNQATYVIDTASSEAIEQWTNEFNRGMRMATYLFKEMSFRKWPYSFDRTYPINKAIFEALGTILCKMDEVLIEGRRDVIVDRYRELCSEDEDFLVSISQSTASAGNVFERREKLEAIFEIRKDDI